MFLSVFLVFTCFPKNIKTNRVFINTEKNKKNRKKQYHQLFQFVSINKEDYE